MVEEKNRRVSDELCVCREKVTSKRQLCPFFIHRRGRRRTQGRTQRPQTFTGSPAPRPLTLLSGTPLFLSSLFPCAANHQPPTPPSPPSPWRLCETRGHIPETRRCRSQIAASG